MLTSMDVWMVVSACAGRTADRMEGVVDALHFLRPGNESNRDHHGFDMTPEEALEDLRKDFVRARAEFKKLELLTLALSIP